jgi:hypothetical protein
MDIRIMGWDMYTNVMMVNWFPNDNTDIHDGLNTLSVTIVIVSSEQGQDKKHTLLDCRWYDLRLDRTIYKAKAGIKVVCYFYSLEVLDRIVPHKHAETKRPVEEHNSYLLKYQVFVETLVHQIGQIIVQSSKSKI